MPKKSALYLLAVILVASIIALIINVVGDPNLNQFPRNLFTSTKDISTASTVTPTSNTNGNSKNNVFENDGSEGPLRVVKVRDGDTI